MEKANDNSKTSKFTGTAIPVGALRTEKSCGIGEFLDLIPFADFCKTCGLEVIQILPVNDTGTESSPYSALSAFALHPIYVSLKELPEVKNNTDILDEISNLQKKYEKLKRFNYKEIRYAKIDLLKKIFYENETKITKDKQLKQWIEENSWIKNYSVFMKKKRENLEASWKEWKDHCQSDSCTIENLWQDKSNFSEFLLHAWIQMRLEQQFKKAAEYVKSLGIKLKGDIPIMMNEDSCDTWAYPSFFIDEMRAGSPPDASNPIGQNWGFPIYNWENLQKDNYSWWKARLANAAKFYELFRIDHVLGFFRIWATPSRETTAVLGITQPFEPIKKKELLELGFDNDRITWISKPHVHTNKIEPINNYDYLGTHGILTKIMDRIGTEELWRFKNSIKNDKDILEADIPQNIKEKLVEFWRDRAFIEVKKDIYSPIWTFQETTSWKSLSDEEKLKLQKLIDKKYAKMEKLWEKQARTILKELTESVKMTACAEDLGSNPICVPKVLKDLKINSLRVVRWCRKWEEEKQPFFDFKDYPALSVTTSSVHDSSTLRSWWLSEKDAQDFYEAFPPKTAKYESDDKIKPAFYEPETARYLLGKIAESSSTFCIHPIQDFLALAHDYYDENPDEERINIPGTVNDFNWTYRLPDSIEKLSKNKELINEICRISNIHKNKKTRSN
ncbi:MAG: 4-alpha-glucanotransferase [Treponemataceae bacterium]